jgi:ATP-dependent 26S proteasome regulatory subunit
MEEAAIRNEPVFLTDDGEYIKEYFKICELLNKKRLMLSKGSQDKNSNPSEAHKLLENELAALNAEIKELEAMFWQKVEKSAKDSRSFAIEEIARHYNLESFEKRILLFFLYLQFTNLSLPCCYRDEILLILDLESSPVSRIRNAKYFHDDSTLIRERILLQNCGRDPILRNTGEYLLSQKALTMVSNMLNGEKVEWETEKKEKISVSSEDIGCIKEPEYCLKDIILNDDIKEKVALFLDTYRDNKFEALGVSKKIKKGKGLIFLFYGPPGTGKSMLAEAIAHSMGKKALMVEYPKITDRWFGETDKHIARIFKSAKANDLVVIMDEADSLLYDRGSFAAQEHDIRFVNIMLQELERFEGVIILTSNMDALLDPALERRIGLKIKFESPDKKSQTDIWKMHIPDNISLSSDISFEALAGKYDFSGGNIKNAVLNAIRRIGRDNRMTMTMSDLVFGADLEKEGMFTKKEGRRIVGFAEKY